jgi:hypothetical protein
MKRFDDKSFDKDFIAKSRSTNSHGSSDARDSKVGQHRKKSLAITFFSKMALLRPLVVGSVGVQQTRKRRRLLNFL